MQQVINYESALLLKGCKNNNFVTIRRERGNFR